MNSTAMFLRLLRLLLRACGDADAWRADEENENDEEPLRGRNGSTRVSQQQWFRYALQLREPLSALLQAGRLFHEVCVDAFASIQTDRLNFIRNNQDAIRMIKASGLLDAAAQEGNNITGADVGVPVILPPSFTGSAPDASLLS
jgi:hypothetical protein